MLLKEFQKKFDIQFLKFIEYKLKEIKDLEVHAHTKEIFSYIQTLAQNGKRFRPYLVETCYKLCGGKKNIKSYLFSVELLHLFALIHDDIMDESTLRHGVKTAQEKFKEYYTINDSKKKKLLAYSQAILAGDLVFAWSQECLLNEENILAKKQYHTLVKEVIAGQSMDIAFSGISHVDEKTILRKTVLKSGNYSIMHPLLMGAHLAGANKITTSWIRDFGFKLGLLFQIQDDLLDCMKTTEEIGKTTYNDIRTKQQTLISWYALHRAEEKYKDQFKKFYGKNKLSTKDKISLRKNLHESGALLYSQKKIKKLEKILEEMIKKSFFNENKKNIWETLLKTITKRSH